MSNPEHVKIIKQGVDVWNAWRKKNPILKPGLNWVDLAGDIHRRGTRLFQGFEVLADHGAADLDSAEHVAVQHPANAAEHFSLAHLGP